MAKTHLTRGTGVVSKLEIVDAGGLTVGGVAVTAPPGDLNYIDIETLGTGAASKAVVLDAGEDYVWPAAGVLTYGVLKDPAATTITATGAELNYNDIATLGTGAASKAVVLDAGEDYTWPATGILKTGVLKDAADTILGATHAEINAVADISAAGAVHKVKKISIGSAPTGAEQDSTWDLPAKALVTDVFVDVTTAEATGATKTLDIGLLSSESGGDADGFAAGIDVSSTGIIRPGVTVITGGTETYVGSWTRGLLLTAGAPLAGANTGSDEGSYYEKPHPTTAVTAKSVSYTSGSGDFVEFRGDIYIAYVELG